MIRNKISDPASREKIDYIYNVLKKQEKNRLYKTIFSVIIFIIIIWLVGYTRYMNKNMLDKEFLIWKISEVISPIIQDLSEEFEKTIKKQSTNIIGESNLKEIINDKNK